MRGLRFARTRSFVGSDYLGTRQAPLTRRLMPTPSPTGRGGQAAELPNTLNTLSLAFVLWSAVA